MKARPVTRRRLHAAQFHRVIALQQQHYVPRQPRPPRNKRRRRGRA